MQKVAQPLQDKSKLSDQKRPRFWLRKLHPSWCFYAWVWGVIIGTIGGLVFEQIFIIPVLVIIASMLAMVACWWFSNPLIMILSLLVGILLGSYRISFELTGREVMAAYVGRTVNISGTLSEEPDNSSGSTVVRLKNLRLNLPRGDPDNDLQISGTIYATLASAPALERSDVITIEGKLGAGFGTFTGSLYRAKVIAVERSETGDIFARFKGWFAEQVRAIIPSPEVDLGLGYLIGMKSGLSKDFASALQMVGMTHVVVASGAHLAILTGAAKKIFGKISKFAGVLFSLLMILAFVLIVGFTPSMTRAALVASLSLLVGYVGRKFTPLRLISFVAMVTLLINPTYVLNLGWQLSFASFFGILILSPHLQAVFYGGKKPPWLASMLITSIATSLICAPILIYNFGTISFLSLIANLIILPTLPYAMLGMMLTGVASMVPLLAVVIASLTTWLLDLHIWIINFLSEQKAFILELPSGNAWFYLLYIPVLVFLLWSAFAKRRVRKLLTSENTQNML